MTQSTDRIRPARFADNRWYSAEPTNLRADLQTYLQASPTSPTPAELVGLVAPHAGYFFSGHVAGAAFARLTAGSFKTVILLGPDHRGAAPGYIATPTAEAWRTPLGDVPVAWNILQELRSEIDLVLLAHDEEHALEIELPFLQVTLQQFNLVPLIMGDQSLNMCRQLSAALSKVLRISRASPVLLVASSDLSHYFHDDLARSLDETTLQFVLNLDAEGLIEHVRRGKQISQPLACGAGPIATVIQTAQALDATQARLCKYATSADVYPAKARVVGYAAVAMTKG